MGVHESKRHVIAIETPSGTHKIFSLGYSEKDSSIFIHLPYLNRDGLIGVSSGVRNDSGTLSVRGFNPVGTTKHGIKFSYHPDGCTHFSQDGKIIKTLPHNGVPLSQKTGPICAITAYGLSGFQRIRDRDSREDSAKKGIWALTSSTELAGVAFTVFLKSENDVQTPSSQGIGSPVGTMIIPTGSITLPAIAIGQPSAERRHDRVLVVAYQSMDVASATSESCLLFRGPYVEILETSFPDGTFFAQSVVYPASLAGKLFKSVSSVDF
ncbi:MAG: hypothetical protein JJE16_04515 [Nitrospiraceae bacterium]|nr:hypothetical protein [Nitrospiraceae bacterium]